jgi:hypothetical protein
MKVRFWIVGKKSASLRGSLGARLMKDRSRPHDDSRYPIRLTRSKKPNRPGGWSVVHSRYEARGSVRYRWNSQLEILECWAVTKTSNRPYRLIGEFVEAVLDSPTKEVKSIHIEVG